MHSQFNLRFSPLWYNDHICDFVLNLIQISFCWKSFFYYICHNSFIQKHKNTVTFQKPKKTSLPVKVRETTCLRCCVTAWGWQELFLFSCQGVCIVFPLAFHVAFLINHHHTLSNKLPIENHNLQIFKCTLN